MYFIFEMQKLSDTQLAIPTPLNTEKDWNQAESKFHSLCAVAAVSSVPKHTVVMIDEGGYVINAKCYEHGKEGEEE